MKRDEHEPAEEKVPLKEGSEGRKLPSEPLQCDDGLQPRREFRGYWCLCCGYCSQFDWLACCLSSHLPCLTIGWNSMRAFKMSWWKECAKYVIALALMYAAFQGVEAIMTRPANELLNKCRESLPYRPGLSDCGDELNGRSPEEVADLPPDPTNSIFMQPGFGFIKLLIPSNLMITDGYTGPDVRDLTPPEGWSAFWLYIFALAVAGTMALWLAYRRGMLREKFNIRGNRCGDCTLWCCCPACAMCQEARTLMHNRVEDGVWLGPPRMDEMV